MADNPTPPNLLLTRPKAASEEFARRLSARRLPIGQIVISPAIAIDHIAGPRSFEGFDGVIATSVHALNHLRPPKGMKAWTVGDATAAAARNAGFSVVNAGGNVDDLIPLVVAERPSAVLYLRGVHVATDIGARLETHGIRLQEHVVYEQPSQQATGEARALLAGGELVIIPLFSPRSARIVSDWVSGASAPIEAIAMSDSVALAWGGPASVAVRPTADAMLRSVEAAVLGTGNG